ncbi:hypothetical protein NDU88_008832 [Pleurodeles waltl]|uniref:Reverse transcriptase n=1 Tax=Pleurodeles waltl TaxID=8319 RepID=A0AAV7P0E0_PLEWA|nr:hypothetical protein NDU88_008832 [Pleurodeles waltl]
MFNKTKNNSKFWQLVNELVHGKRRHSNAGIDAASWEAHVLALYSSLPQTEIPRDLPPTIWNTPRPSDFGFRVTTNADPDQFDLIKDIDIEQLIGIIKKLKIAGAAGQNGIPNAIVKGDATYWAYYLALLFNDLHGSKTLPDAWKGSIFHPIYKTSNPASPTNYRLIALIDVEAKLYASCLLLHLSG